MKIKATYISLWDEHYECRSNCRIDLSTTPPFVDNVETKDGDDGWNSLTKEYIELLDGTIINTFTINEDGYQVINGKHIEENNP